MDLTIKSDIIISICQPHLDHIVNRKKNHEFRKYLLPSCVKRFWIYEPSPVSAIKYIAEVSNGKRPGEVTTDGGFVRNSDFNEGKMADAKFAYEILKLEALDNPVTLLQLKEKGWLRGAPQKYCYVKEKMALDLRDMKTTAIILDHSMPAWPNDDDDDDDDDGENLPKGNDPGKKDIRAFFSKQPMNRNKRSASLSDSHRHEEEKNVRLKRNRAEKSG